MTSVSPSLLAVSSVLWVPSPMPTKDPIFINLIQKLKYSRPKIWICVSYLKKNEEQQSWRLHI